MNRKELNKEVQEIFGKKTIYSLRKFSEYIDNLNPDIIVLMARKAICLFELFNYLGIQKPKGELVSDRALDLEIDYFKDKKVIVVDDTLIIGTTLKSIQEKLISNNINFQIAVFSVDIENWQKKIIIPNYIQEHYNTEELLNFCINEVKAFSLVSMPYLVDFPITKFINIGLDKLNLLIKTNDNIKAVYIPIHLSYLNETYTFLLNDALKKIFYEKIGNSIKSIIEAFKIRIYISKLDVELPKMKIVPIVLLKPLNTEVIDGIFSYIIGFSNSQCLFVKYIKKYEVKLRVIQYYLSLTLGNIFVNNVLNDYCNHEIEIFKCSETMNFLGKKLSEKFEILLKNDQITPYNVDYCIDKANLNHNQEFDDIFDDIEIKGYNIIQSFQKVFTNLFEKREIPAREKIKEGDINQHLLNRLNNGISFYNIVSIFSNKLNIPISERNIDIFSICLDICNDLGISIPIFGNYQEKVYFRAYRHGELGKRTAGNTYLFFKFLMAFCEANNYDMNNGFGNVLIEKLAVIFYRIAAKEDFIDVTYDYSDSDAINIGFYLMGAVLVDNSKVEFFPNNREDWFLTSYCGNYLKSVKYKDNVKYFLNEIPQKEGIAIKKEGEHHSVQLGIALGKAFKTKNQDVSDKTGHPLNLSKLTILASCYTAGDLAMAIAAELNIIYRWLEYTIKPYTSQNQYIINNNIFNQFEQSTVFQSFNQALFKLSWSFSPDRNVEKIIEDVSFFLSDDLASKNNWDFYSKKLGIGQDNLLKLNDINNTLFNIIKELAAMIFEIGNELHYVRFLREIYENIINPLISVNSEFEFIDLKTSILHKRKIVRKHKKDNNILRGEIGFLTDPARIFIGRMQNDVVEYKHFKYRIVKINNYNVECSSYLVFKKYNERLNDFFLKLQFLNEMKDLLPYNYSEINKKMLDYRNSRNIKFLNKEILSILNKIEYKKDKIHTLIDKVKNYYESSRENIVSLLFRKEEN